MSLGHADTGAHLILRWRSDMLAEEHLVILRRLVDNIEGMGITACLAEFDGLVSLTASGPTALLELFAGDIRNAGHSVREKVTALA